MKLRQLARLCEHDEIRPHYFGEFVPGSVHLGRAASQASFCPGGVFLPDITEALVWLEEIQDDYSTDEYGQPESFGKRRAIGAILDALSVREAEADPNQLEVPFTNRSGLW